MSLFPSSLPSWCGGPAQTGAHQRDKAIGLVEKSSTLWIDRNWGRIVIAIYDVGEFTTDALWSLLADDLPPEPRAMGAVIRRLRQRQMIVGTGEYRDSERPECHKRPMKVWRAT